VATLLSHRMLAVLTACLLALSGAAVGCSTDDAVQKDTENAVEDADKAAGNNDEQAGDAAKDAGNDAADAVDDDDGK
jgi:hypothetical protein